MWSTRKLVLWGLLGGVFFAPPIDAGSVFLKNGYIIQGRIVERDADKVILAWTNGKMTIYRRFVHEVVLDPSEEMDLNRSATVVNQRGHNHWVQTHRRTRRFPLASETLS